MVTAIEPLPDPFPCPKCGSVRVLVNADILVDIQTGEPAPGYQYFIAERGKWHCLNDPVCGANGEANSTGPMEMPDDKEEADNALILRHYRKQADHLLDLVAGLGRLRGDNALWIREIAAADYSQLMEITQKLENMLHRIEPEPEDSPSP